MTVPLECRVCRISERLQSQMCTESGCRNLRDTPIHLTIPQRILLRGLHNLRPLQCWELSQYSYRLVEVRFLAGTRDIYSPQRPNCLWAHPTLYPMRIVVKEAGVWSWSFTYFLLDIRNAWNYTSIVPHIFMSCWLIERRDKFIDYYNGIGF